MSIQSPWTGVPAARSAQASNLHAPSPAAQPEYGWRRLITPTHLSNTEDCVKFTLGVDAGVLIGDGGKRHQSYDLTVVDEQYRRAYIRQAGLIPGGKYEVKSLWRRSPRHSFDRRIKVAGRGEAIYGRVDAAIKAFALGLEEEIDSVLEHQLRHPWSKGGPEDLRKFVEETHGFVDLALQRRHSKSFRKRLQRLAHASLSIPRLTVAAHRALTTSVTGTDIANGFKDIDGIFLVAGPNYTLVSQSEIQQFFAFDSASGEGPKLRWQGVVPEESNVRKGKKESK